MNSNPADTESTHNMSNQVQSKLQQIRVDQSYSVHVESVEGPQAALGRGKTVHGDRNRLGWKLGKPLHVRSSSAPVAPPHDLVIEEARKKQLRASNIDVEADDLERMLGLEKDDRPDSRASSLRSILR